MTEIDENERAKLATSSDKVNEFLQARISNFFEIGERLDAFDLCAFGDKDSKQRFDEAINLQQKISAYKLFNDGPADADNQGAMVNLYYDDAKLKPILKDKFLDWARNAENREDAARIIVTIATRRPALAPVTTDTRRQRADSDSMNYQFNWQNYGRYWGFQANTAFSCHKQWRNEMRKALKRALRAGAHIVTFGEFDFPAPLCPKELKRTINNFTKLLDTVKDRPVLLFAGSWHEWDIGVGLENVGMVFANKPLRGDQENPFKQPKMISAKSLGEVLAPRAEPILTTYKMRGYGDRIAILICIDALDSTVIDAIQARSKFTEERRISLVLVPSYDPSGSIARSCQALSYRANCIVVFVNARADARPPEAEVFVSGLPLTKWKTQAKELSKKSENELATLNIPLANSRKLVGELVESTDEISCAPLLLPDLPFDGRIWTIPRYFPDRAKEMVDICKVDGRIDDFVSAWRTRKDKEEAKNNKK